MGKLSSKLSEQLALVHHGTQPSKLSPNAILQTAQADLGRKKRPCFLKGHVADARSPAEVLRRAIEGHRDGLASSNPKTVLVYLDRETLKGALVLAEVGDG